MSLFSRRSNRLQVVRDDEARLLVDPVPEFLRAPFGYDRKQVEKWVAWQQRLLARSRARVLATESELLSMKIELDRLRHTEHDIAHFRMPPNSSHGASRRPRHLRQERRETYFEEASDSLS
jgi:hypothetical protein